jgi:metal dependent phosphohydrolase
MESKLIKTAESIALLAHGEYFDHSKRVALKGKTEEEIVLGYLHDVIEDSGDKFDYDILSKTYKIPDSILTSLQTITRDKTKETYFDYIKRLSTDDLARQVKIYDLEDHLYYKEAIPESLIDRYKKALKLLK